MSNDAGKEEGARGRFSGFERASEAAATSAAKEGRERATEVKGSEGAEGFFWAPFSSPSPLSTAADEGGGGSEAVSCAKTALLIC